MGEKTYSNELKSIEPNFDKPVSICNSNKSSLPICFIFKKDESDASVEILLKNDQKQLIHEDEIFISYIRHRSGSNFSEHEVCTDSQENDWVEQICLKIEDINFDRIDTLKPPQLRTLTSTEI